MLHSKLRDFNCFIQEWDNLAVDAGDFVAKYEADLSASGVKL